MPAGTWLVVVPAAQNPLKPTQPIATDAQRVAMLVLALQGLPRAAVWTDELDRAAPDATSYWVDTVRRARAAAPACPVMRSLLGADQATQFHRWREPEEIVALAEPLVLLRPPYDTPPSFAAALDHHPALRAERQAWLDRVIAAPIHATASTAIRRGGHEDAMHPAVRAYAKQHRIYDALT